jgi:hypothetical protein
MQTQSKRWRVWASIFGVMLLGLMVGCSDSSPSTPDLAPARDGGADGVLPQDAAVDAPVDAAADAPTDLTPGGDARPDVDVDAAVSVPWAVSMGGSDFEFGYAVAVDPGGNAIVVGRFVDQAKFGDTTLISAGVGDLFVAKLSPAGDVLWAISGGGAMDDRCSGVAVDAGGNIYITGQFVAPASINGVAVTGKGQYDLFVAKLTPAGAVSWVAAAGGTDWDMGFDVVATAQGTVYLTGQFRGEATFGSTPLTAEGDYDLFVAKLSSAGQFEWAAGGGGDWWDMGRGIAVDASGNVFVVGQHEEQGTFGAFPVTGQGYYDILVAKLSPNGQFLWALSAGGEDKDRGHSIALDNNGNAYVVGQFEEDATVGTTQLTPQGEEDIVVAAFDGDGTNLWARAIGGPGEDVGLAIALHRGEVQVTGQFEETVTVGTTPLTAAGKGDVLVAGLSSAGQPSWAISGGGNGADEGYGIAVNGGGLYVVGAYAEQATFGATRLTAAGRRDVFVWSQPLP